MSKWRCLEAGCDPKWRHVKNMESAIAAYETHRMRRHFERKPVDTQPETDK